MIAGLNRKARLLKFLKGNQKKDSHDLGDGKYFFNMIQKAVSIKQNIERDYNLLKHITDTVKFKPWRRYLQYNQ